VIAVERLRIELPRREFTLLRKRFSVRFFLYVKCADTCLFVYRCPISDEFFLLLAALQSHVGSQQTINQLPLLILSAEARPSSQKQHRNCQQSSHEARLPKFRCVCKANCQSPGIYRSALCCSRLALSRRSGGLLSTRRRSAVLQAAIMRWGMSFCCV